jgi:pimeloyl-ACP methyl ester carboxylesterase
MTRTLVVAIRGWTNTGDWLLGGEPGGEFPEAALGALRDELPGAEVWAPAVSLPMFCTRDAEEVSASLFQQISARLDAMGDVTSVILAGFSSGSLLARRVFCLAHGADLTGNVRRDHAVWWADRMHRLVVLAGITRGWEFSTASPDHVRFLSPILLGLTKFAAWLKPSSEGGGSKVPFIWQLKRGSPFVVSTRIQYINVMAALRRDLAASQDLFSHPLRSEGLPTTIFLLGARDEFISPTDCTELGPRTEFAYIELDGSNHVDALQLAGDAPAVVARRERVVAAISSSFDELQLKEWALPSGDIDDYLDPMDLSEGGATSARLNDGVEHAVIVVHGIRDHGFWTKRVAREIKTIGRTNAIAVRAPSPSYGFFSMWDFVKPTGRTKATYWFMERYADVRSHFPNAKISFVGHSNGTYIAANAMVLCPAIRFDAVVFAGSVVRRDFAWHDRGAQACRILNYVGNADGVVAFLPAVFEFLRLRWLDVGGAGAYGFRAAEPLPAVRKQLGTSQSPSPALTEVRYVAGGHGAAICEEFWPEIAEFVLLDTVPRRPSVPRVRYVQAIFTCAPAVTILGVVFAALLLSLPLLAVAGVVMSVRHGLAWSVGVVLALTCSMGVSWLAGRFLRAW